MAGHETTDALERLINLGHLSSGVGHHVINGFSAIVSNAELLRLNPPVPSFADPKALADTIIKTALEAATVARRLIDYTRPVTSIEPARAAFQPDTLELDKLVLDVIEAERATSRIGITWETDASPVPPIRGHETQLRSMLAHLLRNAREAIPPRGGTIGIGTSIDSRGWIVIELRDSGRGMEPATLERAVEPFFSTKSGHLGVGLSIAHGIWRRHRGTLSLLSQPGEGTRIRLCVEPSVV
jgi:two-component system, NtrC family, sensor kinase